MVEKISDDIWVCSFLNHIHIGDWFIATPPSIAYTINTHCAYGMIKKSCKNILWDNKFYYIKLSVISVLSLCRMIMKTSLKHTPSYEAPLRLISCIWKFCGYIWHGNVYSFMLILQIKRFCLNHLKFSLYSKLKVTCMKVLFPFCYHLIWNINLQVGYHWSSSVIIFKWLIYTKSNVCCSLGYCKMRTSSVSLSRSKGTTIKNADNLFKDCCQI